MSPSILRPPAPCACRDPSSRSFSIIAAHSAHSSSTSSSPTRRYRIEIDWCIVSEVPRPSSLPVTEQNPRFPYNRQDCERRALWRGLDWSPPDWRLTDVAAASRLGLWILQNRRELFEAYTIMVSRAYWSYGKNISDAAVVEELAHQIGVSDRDLQAAKAAAPELEDELSGNAR